jgi:beta-phosphoglucomutase
MIKLIIFDLDGVLVDTEDIHHTCLLNAVSTVTGMPVDEFSYLFSLDGKTTKYKLSRLKIAFNLSDFQIEQIDTEKQLHTVKIFREVLGVVPSQVSMLQALKKDYTLALASNSRKENVLNILDTLGIISFFSIILSNNDVRNPKPDPEIFLAVMKELNIAPNETLILEDSSAGKYAAITTGANLFPVDSIADVTLENIRDAIGKIST